MSALKEMCGVTALLCFSCAVFATPKFELENSVAQCVDVRFDTPKKANGRYTVETRFTATRALYECGCVSKQLAYRVENSEGKQTAHRRFALRDGMRRRLLLGDGGAGNDVPLKMWIGCAGA